MTALQIFVLLSTIFFVVFGVMLSGGNAVGLILKAIAWILALFGVVMCLAVFGLLLSSTTRLI